MNKVGCFKSFESLELGSEGYAKKGISAYRLNGSEHVFYHPDEQIFMLIRQGDIRLFVDGTD